jgi:hypothetical protein
MSVSTAPSPWSPPGGLGTVLRNWHFSLHIIPHHEVNPSPAKLIAL